MTVHLYFLFSLLIWFLPFLPLRHAAFHHCAWSLFGNVSNEQKAMVGHPMQPQLQWIAHPISPHADDAFHARPIPPSQHLGSLEQTISFLSNQSRLLFSASHVSTHKDTLLFLMLQPYARRCEDPYPTPRDPFLNHTIPVFYDCATNIIQIPMNTLHGHHLAAARYQACLSLKESPTGFTSSIGFEATVPSLSTVTRPVPPLPVVVGICSQNPRSPCRLYIEQTPIEHRYGVTAYATLDDECGSSAVLHPRIPCEKQQPSSGTSDKPLGVWVCMAHVAKREARSYSVCLFTQFVNISGIKQSSREAGVLQLTPMGRIIDIPLAPYGQSQALFKKAQTPFDWIKRGFGNVLTSLRNTVFRASPFSVRRLLQALSRPTTLCSIPFTLREHALTQQFWVSSSVREPLRQLQGTSEGLPPLTDLSFETVKIRKPSRLKACTNNSECFEGYGVCVNQTCRGFIPDLGKERNIKCVTGYICKSRTGDLPGAGITADFQVIAIPLDKTCGESDPLSSTASLFGNSNRWKCEADDAHNCVFSAGVAYPRNASETVEKVRLCGCAGLDKNDNEHKCDVKEEFLVPLGTLSTQECIRNAHCVDRGLASCDTDHCVRGVAIAAVAGLRVLQCLTSQNCQIKNLGSQALTESMKLLPIASSHSCGAQRALDPDAISDNFLPCVVKLSPEGHCEVNLGLKPLGSSRLCGCLGDPGGNGRDCDQPEDFTDEMGFIDIGECASDEDCTQKNSICINEQCEVDDLEPTVVDSIPQNNSFAVPPINEITLIWQETIQFIDTDRKVAIVNMDPNVKLKWEVNIRDPSTYNVAEAGYKVEILQGNALRIVPDISMATFPEGTYLIIYEGGIVADMAKNYNTGAMNIQFTVSQNAGCPYMGVTGFSTMKNNPNGVYFAIEPMNNHAAWIRVGKPETLYIYWQKAEAQHGSPENWVISRQRGNGEVIAYSNTTTESSLRPQGPSWSKVIMNDIIPLYDVFFLCTAVYDTEFPRLVNVSLKNGSTSIPTSNFRLRLTFSKAVTYGHWSNLTLQSDTDSVVLYPDVEFGFRGRFIKSYMNETVDIDLTGLAVLSPGTVYNVSASIGFVTDLWYNYWDEEGTILTFTTYEASCKAYPDLGEGYMIKGNHTYKHGDYYQVECREGYSATKIDSSPNDGFGTRYNPDDLDTEENSDSAVADQTVRKVYCVDGTWDPVEIQCNAHCDTYHGVSPEYRLLPASHLIDQTQYAHGTTLKVECSPNAMTLFDNGNATMVCVNGLWEIKEISCKGNCGPFPSLNSFYDVQLDKSIAEPLAGGTLVGAKRLLTCASPAVSFSGIEQETVVCGEQGWGTINLQCHIGCSRSNLNIQQGYEVHESLRPQPSLVLKPSTFQVNHGDFYVLTCSKNYSPGTSSHPSAGLRAQQQATTSTTVECVDGMWVREQPNFRCFRDCGPLKLGWNYDMVFVSSFEEKHGSKINVKCAEFSFRQPLSSSDGDVDGPLATQDAYETVECTDGRWSNMSFVCNAPCERPENSFGRISYTSTLSQTTLHIAKKGNAGRELVRHGGLAQLYCAPFSEIISGTSPETVLCHNGEWISPKPRAPVSTSPRGVRKPLEEYTSSLFRTGRLSKPKLICQTRCGPRLKDIVRYVYSGGPHTLQQLAQRPLPEGSKLQVQCHKGFSPSYPQQAYKGTVVCTDGRWVEEEPLTCLESCLKPAFSVLFQRGYELINPNIMASDHMEKLALTCRQDLLLRVVPAKDTMEFTATCFNGKFRLPVAKCGPPRCSTLLAKIPETARGCHGPQCTELHTICPTSDVALQPSCNDKVQNGDEQGMDCGGSSCPPCHYCWALPKEVVEGMAWTIDAGQTIHRVADWAHEKDTVLSTFVQGSLMEVMCDSQWDQTSSSPSLGFQTFQCIVDHSNLTAIWVLQDAYNFVLRCASPRCDDSIRNGDEEGIDCGGHCPTPCGTCQDGVLNRDEVDIDCGGKWCLSCRSCSVVPFKSLISGHLTGFYMENNGSFLPLKELWDTRGTQHDDGRKVMCRSKPDVFATLRCRDGTWSVVPALSSPTLFSETDHHTNVYSIFQQLECHAHTPSVNSSFLETVQSPLDRVQQRFFVPFLPESPLCNERNTTSCCGMLREWNVRMSHECGALIFGSRNSQIHAFCTGTCLREMRSMLQQYTGHHGDQCPKLHLLQEMLQLFCSTNPSHLNAAPSSPSAIPTEPDLNRGSSYCFTSAKAALGQIEKIQDLGQSLLEEACLPNSCVRSLFRYLEILAAFYPPQNQFSFHLLPIFRHLSETPFNELENPFVRASYVLVSLEQRLYKHFLQLWTTYSDFSTPRQETFMREQLRQLGLQDNYRSVSLFSLLSVQALSGKLLNFLCLKDEKGNSCGSIVKSILSSDDTGLSRSMEILNIKTPIDSCTSTKCYWEITRFIGQTLYMEGLRTINPYLTLFGLLVRTYGRVSCQISPESRQSCALSFGFNVTQLSVNSPTRHFAISSRPQAAHPTAAERNSLCKCPSIFIGDGLCDLECFNAECDFDQDDCTLKQLFPYVYQSLNALVPITHQCHPFSPHFTCARDNGGCYHHVVDLLKSEGCCTATRLNLLREIHIAEQRLRLRSRESVSRHLDTVSFTVTQTPEQLFLPSLSAVLKASDYSDHEHSRPFVLDRSPAWIEAACQLSLNSMCAAGITRLELYLRFILKGLNYEPLFVDPNYKIFAQTLVDALRQVLSDLLAIPLFDITQIRFWPWDIQVETVIDPGVLFAEISENMKSLQRDGSLQKALNKVICHFLKWVRDTSAEKLHFIMIKTTSTPHTEYRSRTLEQESYPEFEEMNFIENVEISPHRIRDLPTLESTPQITPVVGTLDMHDMTSNLDAPDCSALPDLSFPPELQGRSESLYSLPYDIRSTDLLNDVHVMSKTSAAHGSSREIHCSPGYNVSLINSGPSPQVLLCDRGRWVTTKKNEKKIICRKPCSPYEDWDMDATSSSLSISSVGGNLDGASRVVQCATGYAPLEKANSPETLLCRNGVWDRRSLDCAKEDELHNSAYLTNAQCGNVSLNHVLSPSQVYVVTELLPQEVVNAKRFEATRTLESDSPTTIQLWKASCMRGYVPALSKSEVTALMCVNNTLLASLVSLSIPTPKEAPVDLSRDPSSATSSTLFYKKLVISVYLSYLHYIEGLHSTESNRLELLTPSHPLSLLTCTDDVKITSWRSPSNSRMSDALFYSLLLLGCFILVFCTIVGFYLKRTHCMRRPFFDPPSDNSHCFQPSTLPNSNILFNKESEKRVEFHDLDTRAIETQDSNDSKNNMGVLPSNMSTPQNGSTFDQYITLTENSISPYAVSHHYDTSYLPHNRYCSSVSHHQPSLAVNSDSNEDSQSVATFSNFTRHRSRAHDEFGISHAYAKHQSISSALCPSDIPNTSTDSAASNTRTFNNILTHASLEPCHGVTNYSSYETPATRIPRFTFLDKNQDVFWNKQNNPQPMLLDHIVFRHNTIQCPRNSSDRIDSHSTFLSANDGAQPSSKEIIYGTSAFTSSTPSIIHNDNNYSNEEDAPPRERENRHTNIPPRFSSIK